MTKAVQRRRGTNAEHSSFTGLEGELSVNTTNDSVHVHDGATAGGFELARADGSNVDNFAVGGDLDVTGNVTIGGNITIGDADTDSININADLTSSLIPNADNTYDLGTASKEWRNLYIDGTANVDSLVVDGDAEVQGLRIDAVADVELEFGYANTTHSKIIGDIVTASPIAGQLKFQTSTGGTLYERMIITTNGNVGIGTATPDGTLHVHTASAGSVTASTSADDLVVENSASGGMSILTPDASSGAIFAGSPSDSVGAVFGRWNYDSNLLDNGTAKVGATYELRADNGVTNLTLSGASGSELATFAGNVSIDSTASTWLSGYSALEIGNSGFITGITSGNENISIGSNAYINSGGSWVYKTTNEASKYSQSAGVHYFSTAASGTAGAAVTWTDSLTINASGNAVFAGTVTATGGIYLGGTAAANLLDDYEEGTWTMIYSSETGSFGSITYDPARYSKYTKIGNLVNVCCRMRTDSMTKNTAADRWYLSTPFTCNADAYGAVNVGFTQGFLGEHPESGLVPPSNNVVYFYTRATLNGALNNKSEVSDLDTGINANDIIFTAMYLT